LIEFLHQREDIGRLSLLDATGTRLSFAWRISLTELS
jgi:hypothetical protein